MSLVRLGIRVRAEQAEPALAALLPLLQAGAEEREVGGDVEYSLYAPEGELPRLQDIRALAGDMVVDVRLEPVPDGWERRWHEYLRPVAAGPFVVRPPWIDGSPEDLVIDPGACFGAGTHATTRLALELLAEAAPGAGPLCDWGAGTGVLAIAAARLGWGPVTAVEVDPGALEVIRANAARNGVAVATKWLNLAATPAPWAPVAIANLTRELLLAAAGLVERPPERLIASGMLRDQVDEVAAAFGLREVARRADGEWAAVALAS